MKTIRQMFMQLSMYMRSVNVKARAVHYGKRFTQIPAKRSDFFEQMYFNMSDEFQ